MQAAALPLDEVHDILSRHLRAAIEEVAGLIIDDRGDAGAFLANNSAPARRRQWTLLREDRGDEQSPAKTYDWPDSTDRYTRFLTYQDERGARMGVAFGADTRVPRSDERREMVVVYKVDAQGRLYHGVPFMRPDDYESTGELVSLIRGNGPTRRGMFQSPGELPADYRDFRIDRYGGRIKGGFDRMCVVVDENDVNSMLTHASVQMRLKGQE
jgi:hypothetical protein